MLNSHFSSHSKPELETSINVNIINSELFLNLNFTIIFSQANNSPDSHSNPESARNFSNHISKAQQS